MEGWDQPLCRYMHRPIQVLWFNIEEWYLLAMLYFVGLMSSAAIWIAIVPTVLMVIPAIVLVMASDESVAMSAPVAKVTSFQCLTEALFYRAQLAS